MYRCNARVGALTRVTSPPIGGAFISRLGYRGMGRGRNQCVSWKNSCIAHARARTRIIAPHHVAVGQHRANMRHA